MDYEEFKKEFMEKLENRARASERIGEYKLYEDGTTSQNASDLQFIKSTNQKYNKAESETLIGDFLNIIHKNLPNSHARYEMKYLFDSYSEAGWEYVWKIIDGNLIYAESLDTGSVTEHIDDYEAMKDRLIVRAINYTDNKYILKDFVYRKIGDIALVLYLYVANTEKYGLVTIKLPKESFITWGKDFDEVMETALANSNIRSVPRMYNTPEEATDPSYGTGAYMAFGSTCKLATGWQSSTFTTYPCTNGATSFWYPGVQEKIAKMAGGDYYIAFTGIHDFHVHPVGATSARSVLGNLKNMNRVNPEGETLSRKVYLYHADTKELQALEL